MPISAMSITDSKKVPVIHHEVLNLYVSVLVDFVFFVNCHSFSVADREFGDRVGCLLAFGFVVLC